MFDRRERAKNKGSISVTLMKAIFGLDKVLFRWDFNLSASSKEGLGIEVKVRDLF